MNTDSYREFWEKLVPALTRLKYISEMDFAETSFGFYKGQSSAYTEMLFRTGSGESYRNRLKELTEDIIELAAIEKHAWAKTRSVYRKGRLVAFATFLGSMKRKAIIADFDESGIGLKYINPERDFLGLKD